MTSLRMIGGPRNGQRCALPDGALDLTVLEPTGDAPYAAGVVPMRSSTYRRQAVALLEDALVHESVTLPAVDSETVWAARNAVAARRQVRELRVAVERLERELADERASLLSASEGYLEQRHEVERLRAALSGARWEAAALRQRIALVRRHLDRQPATFVAKRLVHRWLEAGPPNLRPPIPPRAT